MNKALLVVSTVIILAVIAVSSIKEQRLNASVDAMRGQMRELAVQMKEQEGAREACLIRIAGLEQDLVTSDEAMLKAQGLHKEIEKRDAEVQILKNEILNLREQIAVLQKDKTDLLTVATSHEEKPLSPVSQPEVPEVSETDPEDVKPDDELSPAA